MKKLKTNKKKVSVKYPQGNIDFGNVGSKGYRRKMAAEAIAEILEKTTPEDLLGIYGVADLKIIFEKMKNDALEIDKFYEWDRNRPFKEGDVIISKTEKTRHVVIRLTDEFLYLWGGKRGYAQHLTFEQANKRYLRTGENIGHVVEVFSQAVRGEIKCVYVQHHKENGEVEKLLSIADIKND